MDLLQMTEKGRNLSQDTFEVFAQLYPLLKDSKEARDNALIRGTSFGALLTVIYLILVMGVIAIRPDANEGGTEGMLTMFVSLSLGFVLTMVILVLLPRVSLNHSKNFKTHRHALRDFCSKNSGLPLSNAVVYIKEFNPNLFKVIWTSGEFFLKF